VVPQRGYLDHVGGGLTDADINVFGPLARSADDLGLLLTVLAGANEEDAVAWRLDLPSPRHGDLSSCRVGTWLDDPACEVASDVAAVLEDAAAALARAGARVCQDRPPIDLTDANRLFSSLILPAISISLDPEFGAAVSGSHRTWLELDEQRARLRKVWASWFEDHDALLCPVTPMAAFAHDQTGSVADRTVVINGKPRSHADALAWTGLVGVAYLPSTVVPVGLTSSGLPVGIQVIGPYLADRTTLFIAGELSRATGGFVPPPLATGPELG
jgi:amidase